MQQLLITDECGAVWLCHVWQSIQCAVSCGGGGETPQTEGAMLPLSLSFPLSFLLFLRLLVIVRRAHRCSCSDCSFAAPADGKLRTGAPPKCSKCCCCCCCLLCYSLCTDRLCILAAFVNGHDSVFCFLEHRVSSCRCRRQLVKEVVQ